MDTPMEILDALSIINTIENESGLDDIMDAIKSALEKRLAGKLSVPIEDD